MSLYKVLAYVSIRPVILPYEAMVAGLLELRNSPLLCMLREMSWVRTMTFEVPDNAYVGVSPRTLVELHDEMCMMIANHTPNERGCISD